MNWNTIKGYVLISLGSLILIAAALLLIVQGSTTCKVSIYFDQEVTARVNLLMLLSAVGGIIVLFFLRAIFAGISALRKGRLESAVGRKLTEITGAGQGDESHPA